MNYILALDQGTTSSRALLFDRQGALVGQSQKELGLAYPHPGWVEQNGEEIWSTQKEVIDELLTRLAIPPKEIAAIGLTNQRETSLLWDRSTGVPLGNAIGWQDRRTADLCHRWREEGAEDFIHSKTGLTLDPYFSGTKIRWMLEEIPGARARAERGELAFGTVDTWILWKLTQGKLHATDPSNASRTMLLNLHTGEWDEELLHFFNIPRSILPRIVDTSGVAGTTNLWGHPIPIAGVAGDQQSALFGHGCFDPGEAKNTYGTGCFLLLQTGHRPIMSTQRLLSTIAWRIQGKISYALEGSVFAAGAAVQWLRDGLRLIPTAAEVESLALSVADSGGVVLVPAFVGLGAPHWDPFARGTLQGLTRGTGPGEIARATLESIALQNLDLLTAMERDSGIALKALRVDGGATANDLLMQLQADLLQTPVLRPQLRETTAWGAAALAGQGVGLWPDPEKLRSQQAIERTFSPSKNSKWREDLIGQWHKAVERSKGWSLR